MKKKEKTEGIKEEPKKRFHKTKKVFKFSFFTFKTLVLSIVTAIFSLILISFVVVFSLYSSYSSSFKNAKIKDNTTQNTIFDKNGTMIFQSYGALPPQKIALKDIPALIKEATLSAEDSKFYEHGPIDIRGIGRATIENIKSSDKSGLMKITDLFSEKNYTQGGSTITQQLVKNLYLTNEKSFDRKLKEIVYSYELEKTWSKDKIFEEYLNNVYYGEQSIGIKNAALNFFAKEPKDLSLAEVSMLTGLTAAPSRYSPISGDFYEAKKRQEYVLSKMYSNGYISLEEAKTAANEPLLFNKIDTTQILKYPYFVDFVKNELYEKIGMEAWDRGGLKIYTTVDPKVQETAEVKAVEYMQKFAYRKVTNTAIVVLDNENQSIAAMVGGVDWNKSKVNVATSARQPGSSFKPIVYMAGLLNGYSAATKLYDGYVNFGGQPPYTPKNYDGSYHSYVSVRTALANSLNIPAVEMGKLVTIEKVIETAKKLGITTINEDPGHYGLSLSLGAAEVKPVELTKAYSVFANGGKLGNFTGVERILDNEGNLIYQRQKYLDPVIDPKAAFIMSNILSDNKARSMVFGTSNPLTLKDRKVAAKTGTTDDYADSWTMGFTPQYTTGVWMGNNDHSKMARISGIEGAAYIWQDVMKEIHNGLPAKEFGKPEGLVEAYVNSYNGAPANGPGYSSILEYFVPGTEPSKNQDFSYLNQFINSRK